MRFGSGPWVMRVMRRFHLKDVLFGARGSYPRELIRLWSRGSTITSPWGADVRIGSCTWQWDVGICVGRGVAMTMGSVRIAGSEWVQFLARLHNIWSAVAAIWGFDIILVAPRRFGVVILVGEDSGSWGWFGGVCAVCEVCALRGCWLVPGGRRHVLILETIDAMLGRRSLRRSTLGIRD